MPGVDTPSVAGKSKLVSAWGLDMPCVVWCDVGMGSVVA